LKIYYLYLNANPRSNSSVQEKIVQQVEAARKLGYPVEAHFFYSAVNEISFDSSESIKWHWIGESNYKYFNSLRSINYSYRFVRDWAKINVKKVDWVFMRYGLATRPMLTIAWLLKKQLYFNHLSIESREYRLYKSDSASSISRFLSNVEFKYLPIYYDRALGRLIRFFSGGAIVNSNEIGVLQKKMAFGNYSYLAVGDAVNTESFLPVKIDFDAKNIQMVFLKGASMAADYNGLDRLISSLTRQRENQFKYYLTIIGNDTDWEKELIEKFNAGQFVHLKPAMNKQALDIELKKYHLGVGPLAVHRKGIFSTTSIKAREYFARGLPFFFAHHDPGIGDNKALQPYFLQFEATDEPIDLQLLDAFVLSMRTKDNFSNEMHQLAKQYLDYSVQVKQIFDFISNPKS
jgi:hypothetical protein